MGVASEPTLVVKHTFLELVQQDDRISGNTPVRSRRHTDSELVASAAGPGSPQSSSSYFGDGEEIISTPCWSPELGPVHEEPALDGPSLEWQHASMGWEAPGAWYLPQAADYSAAAHAAMPGSGLYGGCGCAGAGGAGPYGFMPMNPMFMQPTDRGCQADWQWSMGYDTGHLHGSGATFAEQRAAPASSYQRPPEQPRRGAGAGAGAGAGRRSGPGPALASSSALAAVGSMETSAAAAAAGSSARPAAGSQDSDANRTTVMVRNLPENMKRAELLLLIDEEGFAGTYDFGYLPFDFSSGNTLGYAFVNLLSSADAKRFIKHFEGFSRWPMDSNKVCTVSWSSPNQGLMQHIERYRNSPVMHANIPDEWKPVLLSQGMRVSFPQPTRPIKQPKVRCRASANAPAGCQPPSTSRNRDVSDAGR